MGFNSTFEELNYEQIKFRDTCDHSNKNRLAFPVCYVKHKILKHK